MLRNCFDPSTRCGDCCIRGTGRICACSSCCQERGGVGREGGMIDGYGGGAYGAGAPGAGMYYTTDSGRKISAPYERRDVSTPAPTYTQNGTQSFLSPRSQLPQTARQISEQPPPSGEAKILQPLIQERIVEVMKPEVQERIIEVPQTQYVETIVEVPQKILKEKIIQVPKPVVYERVKVVKKPVIQETVVEIPEIKTVDKIVEVPQYIYEEKIVKVPKIIVQERVVPVPKKIIKEKICEVPIVEYRDLITEKEEEVTEIVPEIITKDIEYKQIEERPYHVEKVVEVPHVQHVYRNVMTPQYRHIPKPVEVPMTHYRPIPVEKIVDRNVPVPVELQIIQEYLCPKIEPIYKEQPVPVHVQRIIEHPVPKEAMSNPQLLPLYYQGPPDLDECACFQPGHPLYTLSACCEPQKSRITQGGQGTVEILAQSGFPTIPGNAVSGVSGGEGGGGYGYGYTDQIDIDKTGTMQPQTYSYEQIPSGNIQMQQQHMQQPSQYCNNPYVNVTISPQPPGATTTVVRT